MINNRSYRDKLYYLKNRKKISKRNKEYYQKNKEKIKESSRKWGKLNPDKKRQYSKRYRELNPEKAKNCTKRWKRNNPEKTLIINKRYLNKLGIVFGMNSEEYEGTLKTWSRVIKNLDNYMCKLCDSKMKLSAHHIRPKHGFPKLALDLDNGITLCEDCHSEVHGFGIY